MAEETKTIKCSKCGADCNADDTFCGECGAKLDENTEGNKICPKCGTNCNANEAFCGECGADLQANNVEKNDYNIEQQNNMYKNNYSYYNKIKCRYCGSSIDKNTKKCPNCGEWLKGVSHFGCGSFMMLISVIIAICISLSMESYNIPLIGEVGGITLVIIVFLYFLPALIADLRGHDSKFAIFVVNLLFGWSGLGWFIALIFAFTGRSR